MTTVDKALSLLEHFDHLSPALGLAELTRRSGYDKAAVLRQCSALVRAGLLEQEDASRAYRLGGGILRLAALREASQPIRKLMHEVLVSIEAETHETCHGSLLQGDRLNSVAICEGKMAHIVRIEPGLVLPIHATASGHAVLAFASPSLKSRALQKELEPLTVASPISTETIENSLEETRSRGFSKAVGWYESGVTSFAAPIFDAIKQPIGAVSIAAPTSRVDADFEPTIAPLLINASHLLTDRLGGQSPEHYPAIA